MVFYTKYKSPLGYSNGDNQIDSYGVDHSGFSTRDELMYQTARNEREQELIKNYNQQGINENYPQFGTNFWGNSANNYGFGVSNIENNIEKRQFTPIPDTTVHNNGQNKTMMDNVNNEIVNQPDINKKMLKTRYNEDCTLKGIFNNFIKIRKDAEVTKPITTGNIVGDYLLQRIPKVGPYINYYNNATLAGAAIAHGIAAYDESCKNSK